MSFSVRIGHCLTSLEAVKRYPLRQVPIGLLPETVEMVAAVSQTAYFGHICDNLSQSYRFSLQYVANIIPLAQSRIYAFGLDILLLLNNASYMKTWL